MKIWLTLASVVLGLALLAVFNNGRKFAASTDVEGEGREAAAVNSDQPRPVIVELFTSEGCSSCPPADDLLARLDKSQPVAGAEIIVLSQHVDYWNRLGWTDPFSSPAFSARQGDYARAFGKDGVYTPQMIIDGQTEFPGGNQNKAYEAIASASRNHKANMKLTLLPEPDMNRGPLRLAMHVEKLPAVSNGDTAEVLLAITESNLSTQVPRGENAGRRLGHVGVVRSLRVIESVESRAPGMFNAETSIVIDKNSRRANMRAVVFVQERASRRVLGAATISLASGSK